MTGRKTALSIAAAIMLSLGGCSADDAADPATAEASEQSLPDMLDGTGDLATFTSALDETGLDGIFNETAFYTLLAPGDDAFAALETGGATLDEEEQRAAMAAILRGHILPGYLTREDIEAAIEAQDSGSVEIRTMGEQPLTFTREGEAIRVTSGDGSTALLGDADMQGSNGVVLPVDTVLKQL